MCKLFLQISHLVCKNFHHDWQFMRKLFLNVLTCCVKIFCFWSHSEQTFLKLCISCVNFVPTFSAHCTLVSKPSVNFMSVSRRARGCACRGLPVCSLHGEGLHSAHLSAASPLPARLRWVVQWSPCAWKGKPEVSMKPVWIEINV